MTPLHFQTLEPRNDPDAQAPSSGAAPGKRPRSSPPPRKFAPSGRPLLPNLNHKAGSGRPKGSKDAPREPGVDYPPRGRPKTILDLNAPAPEALSVTLREAVALPRDPIAPPRGPGRPLGSKTKPRAPNDPRGPLRRRIGRAPKGKTKHGDFNFAQPAFGDEPGPSGAAHYTAPKGGPNTSSQPAAQALVISPAASAVMTPPDASRGGDRHLPDLNEPIHPF